MEFPKKRPSYEKERRDKILKEIEHEYSLKDLLGVLKSFTKFIYVKIKNKNVSLLQ